MSSIAQPAPARAPAVTHYENFPVASWLCPARLRPPIAAIYHFARTADDLADEGDADAAERLSALALMRRDLAACANGHPPSGRWPAVFGPLGEAMHAFGLPEPLLADLLDAFAQDVVRTRDGMGYADRADLLDYCRRSANPVGRLLLHLWGMADARSLRQSDAICTGLQLVNHWQDLSRDIPRGRWYLPESDLRRHGLTREALATGRSTPASSALVAELCRWARSLLLEGAPLALRVPGRAGWELRLVVQGGLRVLDRIAALGHATLEQRPTLGRRDLPLLLWRAARMRAGADRV